MTHGTPEYYFRRGYSAYDWDRQELTVKQFTAHFRELLKKGTPPLGLLEKTNYSPAIEKWRAKLTKAMINKTFDLVIEKDSKGPGIETTHIFSHYGKRLLEHLSEDEKAKSFLSAENIHDRFQDALGENKLAKAAVILAATEDAPWARELFTSQDISKLYKACLGQQRGYELILLTLRTTDSSPKLRDDLTPNLIAYTYREVLSEYEKMPFSEHRHEKHPHYPHVAQQLLKHTIGDDRLRSGIEKQDIKRLIGHFNDEAQITKKQDWFFPDNRVDRAIDNIVLTKLFTLENPTFNELRLMLSNAQEDLEVSKHQEFLTGIDHTRNRIDAIKRYPTPIPLD